jgi:hypothetical protein
MLKELELTNCLKCHTKKKKILYSDLLYQKQQSFEILNTSKDRLIYLTIKAVTLSK